MDGLLDYSYLAKEIPDHKVLNNEPLRIFNEDGSDFKTGKVLAKKGARHVYNIAKYN
jgi:hypothetical protein